MAAPGLFPEGEARPLRLGLFLPLMLLLVFVALAVVHGIWAHIRIQDMENQLVAARSEIAALQALAARSRHLEMALEEARVREYEAKETAARRRAPVEPEPAPPEPAPAPPPAVPPQAGDRSRLGPGKEAFRAGRYAEAQVHFFRARPEGYVYLALSSLARGDLDDALAYLVQAMEADPRWLSLQPRALFGSEAEFLRVLEEAQARVDEDPLDPQAKLLLAYLHYHEKGSAFAKALLTEITTADPDHAGALRFLKSLDK